MRELNFHWEDGSLGEKNARIGEETCQLSRGTCQNFFLFTFVAVGVTFLKVIFSSSEKGSNLEFSDSVLVFVR